MIRVFVVAPAPMIILQNRTYTRSDLPFMIDHRSQPSPFWKQLCLGMQSARI
jgi:hypothetical protein